MDFKSIGKIVGQYAPLLGDILPIPGAGIAGKLISAALGCDNTPDAIHTAIQNDPEAAIKLAKIESDNKALLQQQMLSAETSRILSVNATMQAETRSEHFMQWSWRPFNGYLFGCAIVGVYFLLPILELPIPDINPMVWTMWGGVLGVTAWHRGSSKAAGK